MLGVEGGDQRRSCGARQAASWVISPRAHARERSRSPVTASTPTPARSTTTASLRSSPRRSTSRRASCSECFWYSASGFMPQVELDRAVERDRALADAHVHEVAVVGAALPDLAALDDLGPELLRLRVQALERGALQIAASASSRSRSPRYLA